jgi:mono/diheme cytochrome c family protein
MSDQPYHRPLEGSDVFADGRASRPLERGVIHRAQRLDVDPLVTGLTREEWTAFYKHAAEVKGAPPPKVISDPDELQKTNAAVAFGSPRFDPPVIEGRKDLEGRKGLAREHPGPQIYAEDFPIPIDEAAYLRGKDRYTIYCAVCHGPLGNGQGKLWERRYLQPTSFHVTPVGPDEVVEEQPRDIPLGYSRNYGLWGIKMPMPEAPVGYYFEIITKGVPGGGMPSYAAQIPPEDRWKIIWYIKVLQMSQRAPADLVQKAGVKVEAGGKP